MSPIHPSLKALVVCDTVIDDRATGKKSLIGIFTHLGSIAFPCQHPQVGIYFCITDAEGVYNFSLELICVNAEQVVGKGELPPIEIKNRLDIADFGVTMRPVIFSTPGRYEFRLSANGLFLGMKDFNVLKITQEEGV